MSHSKLSDELYVIVANITSSSKWSIAWVTTLVTYTATKARFGIAAGHVCIGSYCCQPTASEHQKDPVHKKRHTSAPYWQKT